MATGAHDEKPEVRLVASSWKMIWCSERILLCLTSLKSVSHTIGSWQCRDLINFVYLQAEKEEKTEEDAYPALAVENKMFLFSWLAIIGGKPTLHK